MLVTAKAFRNQKKLIGKKNTYNFSSQTNRWEKVPSNNKVTSQCLINEP